MPQPLVRALQTGGLTVSVLRDPDIDGHLAGIVGVARLAWKEGRWAVAEQMNGDQTDRHIETTPIRRRSATGTRRAHDIGGALHQIQGQ